MTTKPVVELVFRRDVFGLPQLIKVCVCVAFNVKSFFKKEVVILGRLSNTVIFILQ